MHAEKKTLETLEKGGAQKKIKCVIVLIDKEIVCRDLSDVVEKKPIPAPMSHY
jgi:hypothetical protein